VKYLDRIPVEFAVMVIKEAVTTRNPQLANTKTFIQWQIKHQSVFL
jgi:hypothetical protein